MKLPSLLATLALVVPALAAGDDPGKSYFSDWPDGADPKAVGKGVSEEFLTRKFRHETNPQKAHLGVIYPEACVWYGALTFADVAGDEALEKKLIAKFEPYLTDERKEHINHMRHVDYRMVSAVPFEIAMLNGDKRALALGKELADGQWEETTDDGVTAEARYWIDDMYMIPIAQTQAFRATGDAVYLDRAARAMVAYLDKLQKPNGLFHHGDDSAYYWGRGNGWVAAGMAELLSELPQDHKDHARILKGYRAMMAALKETQDDDGMWRQLLDNPESWPETSCTGMFTFAFVTGVRNGWLDAKEYGPAARKAWIALTGYINDEALVREVCIGTDKGHSTQFYLDRPRATGDLHGQAPILWSATALLEKSKANEP